MSIDHYEKSSNRFFAALLLTMPLLVGSTGTATANEPGMVLCGSPSFSGDLWRGLMQIQETGVQVDRKIASEVAKKLGCPFFASATLRPVQCPSSNDLRLFGLWKNGVSGSVCGLI